MQTGGIGAGRRKLDQEFFVLRIFVQIRSGSCKKAGGDIEKKRGERMGDKTANIDRTSSVRTESLGGTTH